MRRSRGFFCAVMSSESREEVVSQALQAGATEYLVKPIRRRELSTLWQHVHSSPTGSGASIPAAQPAPGKPLPMMCCPSAVAQILPPQFFLLLLQVHLRGVGVLLQGRPEKCIQRDRTQQSKSLLMCSLLLLLQQHNHPQTSRWPLKQWLQVLPTAAQLQQQQQSLPLCLMGQPALS